MTLFPCPQFCQLLYPGITRWPDFQTSSALTTDIQRAVNGPPALTGECRVHVSNYCPKWSLEGVNNDDSNLSVLTTSSMLATSSSKLSINTKWLQMQYLLCLNVFKCHAICSTQKRSEGETAMLNMSREYSTRAQGSRYCASLVSSGGREDSRCNSQLQRSDAHRNIYTKQTLL